MRGMYPVRHIILYATVYVIGKHAKSFTFQKNIYLFEDRYDIVSVPN